VRHAVLPTIITCARRPPYSFHINPHNTTLQGGSNIMLIVMCIKCVMAKAHRMQLWIGVNISGMVEAWVETSAMHSLLL